MGCGLSVFLLSPWTGLGQLTPPESALPARGMEVSIRIGANPIGWSNDDLLSLGGATPLEVCLAEAKEAARRWKFRPSVIRDVHEALI